MILNYAINPEVEKRIKTECENAGYTFIVATKKSKHPDDKHLYVVIAKRETVTIPTYAFWSCYNDERQTLNHGHYGYIDLKQCINAAMRFCGDEN